MGDEQEQQHREYREDRPYQNGGDDGDRDRDRDNRGDSRGESRGGGYMTGKKLYIKHDLIGKDDGVNEDMLRETFSKFGEILKTWISRPPSTYAFIEYKEEQSAQDAQKELNSYQLLGYPLMVEMAQERRREERDDRGRFKPGDWECPRCRANNFARRDVCFKCGTPKPRGGGGGGYRRGGGGGYDERRRGGRSRDRRDDYRRDDRRDDRRRRSRSR